MYRHLYREMRHSRAGDICTFIQSLFDFTSDLYSLPRTYTGYLGQYGIHLGQYEFISDTITPVLQVQLFELNVKYLCLFSSFHQN